MPLLEELNDHQRKAVDTVNGRVLILAGAGSGKTRVLTLRIAHLIKNLKVSPKSILGLTFTNKAAAEMRSRIGQYIDIQFAKHLNLCTFHSFCMQILRAEIHRLGYTPQFTLYDEKDIHRLISCIARDLIDKEGELPSLASTVEAISMARNKGQKAEEIVDTGSQWHDQFTQQVYSRLQASMRAYNAVDFDTLLSLTVELFEKHPDVLLRYQERYRYLMIDEYQDTNPIQDRLASLLASKYQNLCVVGDDDQSIYGWRGADIRNILSFPHDLVVKLEQNYRSTNMILKAANAVIACNTHRHSKKLWSQRGEGEPIQVFYAPNEVEEANAVIYRMDKLRLAHRLRWSDMAILYRSNALSRNFEQSLMRYSWQDEDNRWIRGIPYQIFGGLEFYERREVKDLFAYLRVIVNPLDQEALLRIVNFPRRGIGESALDLLTAYNRTQGIPLWKVLQRAVSDASSFVEIKEKLTSKAFKGIQEFLDIIEMAKLKFSQMPLQEAMRWLIEKIHYAKAIEEEVKSQQMRDFKMENIQEFVSALAQYEEDVRSQDKIPSLHDFVTSLPLYNETFKAHSTKNGKENKVSLMTFHSAKGLEFPACFLVGMENHIIPHEKSVKGTGIEEERRLMYVAITRAMNFLTISMACKRKRMGIDSKSQPSRFLFEIPKELMNFTEWDKSF